MDTTSRILSERFFFFNEKKGASVVSERFGNYVTNPIMFKRNFIRFMSLWRTFDSEIFLKRSYKYIQVLGPAIK